MTVYTYYDLFLKQKIIWNWQWALVFIHATYISVQQTTSSKKKKKKNLWPFFDFIECLYENKDHIPVSKNEFETILIK